MIKVAENKIPEKGMELASQVAKDLPSMLAQKDSPNGASDHRSINPPPTTTNTHTTGRHLG